MASFNSLCSNTKDINNMCRGNINPMTNITMINQPICLQNSLVLWVSKIVGNNMIEQENVIITDNAVDSNQDCIFIGYFGNDKCREKSKMGSSESYKFNNESNLNFITAYNSDGTTGGKISSSKHLDIIIAKYNSLGFLLWITKISGVSGKSKINIKVDSCCNIIITGSYFSFCPVVYDVHGQKSQILPPSCGYTSFIVKYDPNGNLLWSTIISSSKQVLISSIAIDILNNIYLIGSYHGSNVKFFNIDGTVGSILPDNIDNDIFLAKYSQNGIIQWTSKISNFNTDTSCNVIDDIRYDIAITNDCNIIISGIYTGTIIFHNSSIENTHTAISLTSNSNITSIFLVKYSTIGSIIWATKINNISNIPPKICIDHSSNIILAGSYYSHSIILLHRNEIKNIKLTNLHPSRPNECQYNIFISKIDHHGDIIWGTRITGNNNDFIFDLAIDNNNDILITGSYTSSFITAYNSDFTSGPRLSNSSINHRINSKMSDAFIIKYNTCGKVLWATKQSGINVEQGTAISTNANNSIIGSGFFSSPKLFFHNSDGSLGQTLINNSFNCINSYLVKYVNYGQTLTLSTPLIHEHFKTIILNGYRGINTLINVDIGVMFDLNNYMIKGIILLNQGSTITLKWCNNRWTILSETMVIILYS